MRRDGHRALRVRYHAQHDGYYEQFDECHEQRGGHRVQRDGCQELRDACHEQRVNTIVFLVMFAFLPISSSFPRLGGRRAAA